MREFFIAVEVQQTGAFAQPKYRGQQWPSFDIGIFKTSENKDFAGNYTVDSKLPRWHGSVELFACGKTSATAEVRARGHGENSFLRIGALLFLAGTPNKDDSGTNSSIAPNDSGGPLVEPGTNKIIAVATTTTAGFSQAHGVPILSTGTATATVDNLNFILAHLGP